MKLVASQTYVRYGKLDLDMHPFGVYNLTIKSTHHGDSHVQKVAGRNH